MGFAHAREDHDGGAGLPRSLAVNLDTVGVGGSKPLAPTKNKRDNKAVRGLKVFKARGDELRAIVNYREPRLGDGTPDLLVNIGEVRYASTNRPFQQISGVRVAITPTDLLGQKTALFGMTRRGKSNTTKIILKAIFALRWDPSPRRIGQIVFDPNGEYANENTQDADQSRNPSAIKNVWACGPSSQHAALQDDVVTYGITPHPNDPRRRLMLLNFYVEENLQIGKGIIDSALSSHRTSTSWLPPGETSQRSACRNV